jgi:hypothetical protein
VNPEEIPMLALVLVAAVASADPDAPIRLNALHDVAPPPAACRLGRLVTRATPGEARALRLGDLPKARHEIAVDRRVNGCQVPVVVRYDVEGDGRAGR